MQEQSKAAKRRFNDGNFHSKYFRGAGIDIGAGNDCLDKVRHAFPGIESVRNWDLMDGDGQELTSVEDNSYDFLHSSHSLEHMVDWKTALDNWIRVVVPGGYLIITVPEENMYEKNQWPSRFNGDHKWSFTVTTDSKMPKTVNVFDLAKFVADRATVEKIEVINQFYDTELPTQTDQTLLPNIECCIEIILRKR